MLFLLNKLLIIKWKDIKTHFAIKYDLVVKENKRLINEIKFDLQFYV
jgi:hypothetical protein